MSNSFNADDVYNATVTGEAAGLAAENHSLQCTLARQVTSNLNLELHDVVSGSSGIWASLTCLRFYSAAKTFDSELYRRYDALRKAFCMKKFIVASSLFILLAGSAHASVDDIKQVLSVITLGPFVITSIALGGDPGFKEVYVAQVRDDAADYVANGGTVAPSALLKDALNRIRENVNNTAEQSDLEIAEQVVAGN